MKQLLRFLLLVITFTNHTLYAQRSTDLEVTLLSPSNGDDVSTGQFFTIEIQLSNLGPDTLHASDSLRFQFLLDGIATIDWPSMNDFTYLNAYDLAPGDSQSILIMNQFANTPNSPLNMCVSLFPYSSLDSIADPYLNNNTSCASITVDGIGVSVAEETTQELRMYPNPANNTFSVYSTESILKLQICDVNGSVLHTVKHPQSQQVDCAHLANGTYLITLESASGIRTEQLQIHH